MKLWALSSPLFQHCLAHFVWIRALESLREGRRSERAGVAFDGCQHHRFGLL